MQSGQMSAWCKWKATEDLCAESTVKPLLEHIKLSFCSSFAMAEALRPQEAKKRIRCFLYVEKTITFTH